MTTYIYGLICPIDGELKYIGKANNCISRLRGHMQDFRAVPIDRLLWIHSLKQRKLKPIIEVLEEVNINQWEWWEEWYINYFKSLGIELFNKRAGGNGLKWANHATYKPGNIPHNKGKIKAGNHYI